MEKESAGGRSDNGVAGLRLDRSVTPRAVREVAVIGAGTMGRGIVQCFADAGYPVYLLEAVPEALDQGVAAVRRSYASAVGKGRLSQTQADQRMALIRPTLDHAELRQADLIIEAVFEDLSVKREVFEWVDRIARPGAVLATNTSYLRVAEIAAFTTRPQDVVGMHFFSPANVMKLLEVVRAPNTADEVLATAIQIGEAIGKVAIPVGDCDGFVGNRMLAQRTREIYFLLEEGALPQQVDQALVDFGFAMGPFAVGDMSGLDIGWNARKARAHLRKPGVRDCDLLEQVCSAGRLGQKTGAGWYRYEPGSRKPLPDPEVEALILAHSRARGMERRVIADAEIVERCLLAMINEGAKILQEGMAASALDIDRVWLNGYGFPRGRGGPMRYADQLGLDRVLQGIDALRARFGPDFWTPAALLEQMRAEQRRFYAGSNDRPDPDR